MATIGSGLAALGQSIGGAIKEKKEKEDLLKKQARAAEALAEANPDLLPAGTDIHGFKLLSAEQKSATMDAAVRNVALSEQMQGQQQGKRQGQFIGSLHEAMSGQQGLDTRGVLAAAAKSGLQDVGALSQAAGLIREPGATPGTIRDIPGLPGYKFGIQSPTGSGSFLPLPKPAAGGLIDHKSMPWLSADSEQEFFEGMSQITDPAVRKQVTEERKEILLRRLQEKRINAEDKMSLQDELLRHLMGLGGAEPGAKPQVKARYNPKTGRIERN